LQEPQVFLLFDMEFLLDFSLCSLCPLW
jgi:hypothetical protein